MRSSTNTYTSTIKLEGIEELAAMLRVALLYHEENRVRRELAKAAKPIIEQARNNVISNDAVETGLLRDSIKVLPKYRRDPTGVYIGPIVKRRRMSKREAQRTAKTLGVSVGAYYAHFVEYGVNKHNLGYNGTYVKGKGGEHPGLPSRPYMRPAYDTQGQASLNMAMELIWKMIEDKVSRNTISDIAYNTKRGGRRLY